MAEVVLYTKPGCPYCIRAMALLDSKSVTYENIIASSDPGKKAEMVQRSNGRVTFPQIFIDGRHIGGSDELHALDRGGKLDPLLAA